MNHQIYPPNQDLSTFVECYWTLESPKEKTPEKNTIVPDGSMKMIFHYGDLYKQYFDDGSSIILPKCFVIGQLTRPLEVEPTGETGTFFVRFHPYGFWPFATIPIKRNGKYSRSIRKAVWKGWTGNRTTDFKCPFNFGKNKID